LKVDAVFFRGRQKELSKFLSRFHSDSGQQPSQSAAFCGLGETDKKKAMAKLREAASKQGDPH
jgi:hypothetical protein